MKACVDIGGTKVAVTLAQSGQLLTATRVSEPTAKTGHNDALAQQVVRLIDQATALARAAGVVISPLTGVGISSCGPFVLNQGQVELSTPNICGGMAGPARGLPNDWATAPLEAPVRSILQARQPDTPISVRVENDGVAALEAERHWGALQGLDHCAYVTWSTGVGVGLCVGGQILRGKNGNAGHAGHSFVSDDDATALCGCGNLGDVEGLVAGNAIARRFGMDAEALLTQAAAGDAAANAKVDALCRVMGRMIYNLVATLDLQAVSMGGSVFWHHQALLLPKLRAEIRGKLPAMTDDFKLLPAGLGLQLGDYAALALVSGETA
jgi:glucokinase